MPISLECQTCKRTTFLDDDADEVACSGCGQMLSLTGGGPTLIQAGDALAPRSPNSDGGFTWNAEARQTFKPLQSDNPCQSPAPFESPSPQIGWTGARDPRLADRFTRWLGAVIDSLFVILLMGVGIFSTAWLFESEPPEEVMVAIVYSLLGIGVLTQSLLITLYGQTVGKLLLGTKIVNLHDDQALGFLRGVVLRYWLQGPLSMIPFFSFIDAMFIFNEDKRCVHDHMAGTRVIRIR